MIGGPNRTFSYPALIRLERVVVFALVADGLLQPASPANGGAAFRAAPGTPGAARTYPIVTDNVLGNNGSIYGENARSRTVQRCSRARNTVLGA